MVRSVLGNLGTLKFQAYKLHWKMMKWEKIKSLGDQAIFLACNDSVCVQADESTVYKMNCIISLMIYVMDAALQRNLGCTTWE